MSMQMQCLATGGRIAKLKALESKFRPEDASPIAALRQQTSILA
jgi:imidazoleglycerol-phosphate dehydratase